MQDKEFERIENSEISEQNETEKSVQESEFSASVISTVPRESLTMPSFWKYLSIRVITSLGEPR